MTAKAETDSEKLAGCLVLLALLPIASATSAVVNGYVLATLWRWFVVTTFHVAPISVAAAAGLTLIVSWLTYRVGPKTDETALDAAKDMLRRFTLLFVLAGFALLCGYVIKTWWLA